MGKLDDYSLSQLPQETQDLLDDMRRNWNFGKYQIPVVTSEPGWTGRMGEYAIYASANTWSMFVCTSDKTARWVAFSNFYP
jgi:hypothetical protein